MVLKIKEGLEDLEILYKDKYIGKVSYVDLGFSATKTNHKPNRAWKLLIILSVLQRENITLATPEKLMSMFKGYAGNGITKENVYQIKKLLSDALKIIFRIEEDPFTDRKEYYEPKFTILPEPTLRNEEPWSKRLMTGESQEPNFFEDKEDESPYNDETLFSDEDPDDDKDINEEY